MITRDLRKILLRILLVTACVSAGAFFLVSRLLDPEAYRERILAMAEKALDRRVSCTGMSLSWNPAPSLVFRGVVVRERKGSGAFLSVDRLTVSPALLPLLRKQVLLREIVLDRPRVWLARDRSGRLSVSDLPASGPAESRLRIGAVRIRNGTVRFDDRMVDPAGLVTSLEGVELSLGGTEPGTTADFRLSTRIGGEGEQARITGSGTVRIPPKGRSFATVWVDTVLSIRKLDAGRYWSYYGRYLPCERLRGSLDLEGGFRGGPTEFSSRGSLRVSGLRLAWPRVFRQPLTPRELRFSCDLKRTPRDLSIPTFNLALDGLSVKGSCTLKDLHTGDPAITARASTSPFRLDDVRRYIPLGIIPRGTAEFIEHRIAGGVYRLDRGSLDGRVSRILQMGRDRNHEVLKVLGRVDGGIVRWGPEVPLFSNIRGELELSGRDFTLRRMSGRFGASPFTLEGKIAGYSRGAPCGYPFAMDITPTQAEIAWLLGRDRSAKLSFSGGSLLRLAGSGTAAEYRLSGAWDLTRAGYAFPGLAGKPAGLANRVSFRLGLDRTAARLTELHYDLPPLELTADAFYPFDAGGPASFSFTTNRFPLDEDFPILPGLGRFRPKGMLQAAARGTVTSARSDAVHWNGSVSFTDFSLRPSPRIRRVTRMNGTVLFRDALLETDRLTGTVGNSDLSVSGRLSGFTDPAGSLTFSSPALHLEDLGFGASGEDPEIRNLAGEVSLEKGIVAVSSLSGQFRSSPFALTGEVRNIREPKIALRAHFPFLRVEDLVFLGRITPAGDAAAAPSLSPVVTALVTSDAGTLGDISFSKLHADLSLENSRLLVSALRAGVFGGAVSGAGAADFGAAKEPGFQAHYLIDQIDAAQLVRAAGGRGGLLAGLLTAEGKVAARGKDREGLYTSAQGTAKLEIRKGTFRPAPDREGGAGYLLPFDGLRAELSFGNRAVEVAAARMDLFGGVVSGQGGIDFAPASGPDYRFSCRSEKIDADRLLHAFGVGKEISGGLTLQGDLTAHGGSFADLKKSARGSVSLRLAEGTINKFSIFAKVFSILNVSNLVKLQLPDMVGRGLPYQSIDGTFSFTDGTVETKDLFINTPSINMMVVGTADIVNEEMDITLGVQPLQTVGKVVSRIPVIGWILTGGDRSLLVTYFKAKGKWGDPEVSAIPVQSLFNGVFNIFKRTFNLPDKLVTDTGEVILGR